MSGAIWVDGWGYIEMAGGSERRYMGRWLGVYRNGRGQWVELYG